MSFILPLLAPGQDHFEFAQWEDDIQLLDQPIKYFDGVNAWLPEMDQSVPQLDLFAQDSSSSTYGTSSTRTANLSILDKDLDSSSNHVLTDGQKKEESQKAISKPQTKRKGRPKLDLDDPEAVKERRRKQIRVSQQAYRHRKEASITSIQKENEEIRLRLEKVQSSFNQLLSISLKSNLPLTELSIVQALSEVVEQQVQLQPSAQSQSHKSTQSQEERSRSPKLQELLTDIPGSISRRPNIINGPYVSLLDQVPYATIPFSLRLRIEALKYGHNLIKSPETSFDALRQTFQHHIFTETRESIFRRIHQQLDQSMELLSRIGESSRRQNAAIGDLGNSYSSRESSLYFNAPTQNSRHSAAYYSTFELEPTTEEALLDDGKLYVYSAAVEKHLLERGLIITAGSHFVTIPAGSELRISETPTMFDEIRGNRELKLSIQKLMSKLLISGACLDIGPGFRRMEIDRALRSSIVESV